MAFDTLRAARKLRDEGGFDERQAAILVDTFAEGMTETLATKADLELLRGDLEKTEESLRAEIEKSEAALRNDLEKSEAALRGDLEKTEAALRAEIEKSETSLRGEMRELEQRMTIRLGAMMVGAVALIVVLIKLV
ncbi:MAG: hypothetical protein OXE57_14135 [Alphaproteobacteria bacterium]|nr:hypothetical protein [Alphaproteobacteria bacterium]